MNAGSIADLTDHFVLRKIDNDNFCRVREMKDDAPRRINGHIIPSAVAADWDFIEKFVGSFGSGLA